MRNRNGDARSRPGSPLDTRPVLGLSALRPPFLDDVSPTQPRKAGAGRLVVRMQEDEPDEEPDDDRFYEDPDEDDDSDEDDDDEEEETWQVVRDRQPL